MICKVTRTTSDIIFNDNSHLGRATWQKGHSSMPWLQGIARTEIAATAKNARSLEAAPWRLGSNEEGKFLRLGSVRDTAPCLFPR